MGRSLRFAPRAICERLLIDCNRSATWFTSLNADTLYCSVSRYRPPTTPGSKYITPEGAQRLRDELDRLWHDERPRVTVAVSEAAAQGDRSENDEYTYGKKRLHEIDRRGAFLRARLHRLHTDPPPPDPPRP